jgi:hypothetical protein
MRKMIDHALKNILAVASERYRNVMLLIRNTNVVNNLKGTSNHRKMSALILRFHLNMLDSPMWMKGVKPYIAVGGSSRHPEER